MCINITVAETVPDEAFGRIVALTHELGEIDTNFEGLPIEVKRGDVTNVALVVSDAEDEMRERLLQLLVEDALEAESALPRTTRGPEDHSHAYGTTPSAHRGGQMLKDTQPASAATLDRGFQ
ncbi:hypothetical protein ACN9MJ_14785 [Acidovorax facilis]|uniref:hypothetical protein n=1 Tax=Acidovorax facilis TaxID=12917 RepID=UPI003CE7FEAD